MAEVGAVEEVDLEVVDVYRLLPEEGAEEALRRDMAGINPPEASDPPGAPKQPSPRRTRKGGKTRGQ